MATTCCFEGPGTRYRCDPEKLWTLLRDVAATLPPAPTAATPSSK
jgi:hypothetical protein